MSTKVLLVDWLGRGGIAHTSEAWVAELDGAGQQTVVVTRPDRELASTAGVSVEARPGRIRAHQAVAEAAARTILEHRPDTVVVQNYAIPTLEWGVYRAARQTGARLVLVVHDHRLHSRLAGNHVGLRRCIRAADTVVAHSDFVARSLAVKSGRTDIVRLPLPAPLGMLARDQPADSPTDEGPGLLAIHFGTLQRGYKGTSTVLDLARAGVTGWRFTFIGPGAPESTPGFQAVPGYVASGALVSAVSQSDATILPYSYASQSGAVVLAQALGSAVVVTGVGGIPEQVKDGVTGRLLPPGAPASAWRAALAELSDSSVRAAITEAASARVWQDHAAFSETIRKLVA